MSRSDGEEFHREPRYFLLGRMRAIERAVHREMLASIVAAGYPYMRMPHIALMAHLTAHGRRVTELAELMQVTKSAASQLVSSLEGRGLVTRVGDPADGRATLVRATAAADLGFRVARHRYAEVEDEWAAALGPRRLDEFARTIGALEALRLHSVLRRRGARSAHASSV